MVLRWAMTRGKKKLSCETVGLRLKKVRKERGLSARELSVAAGLSPSVVQMIEDQRRLPGLDTIEKLAAALGVSTAWLGFGIGPQNRDEVSYYVMPDFDPLAMARELEALLRGPGGHIEQSYKYLDSLDAHHWCELTQQGRYSTMADSKPLTNLAERIVPQVGRAGLDVIGLGVGTGENESLLVRHLLDGECSDLRLYLLDISQPLLSIACQRATKILNGAPSIPITAIHGNFHALPGFEPLLQMTHRRQRLVTMFGGTFGNLDNEVRFLRGSVSGQRSGDLLLIDISLARAPAQHQAQIIANEPVLSKKRSQELLRQLKLQEQFNIDPLLRYRRDIVEFEFKYSLDTTSCVIPGSYAIHMTAEAQLSSGGKCLFSLGYIKRYDIPKLSDWLAKEGWDLLAHWEYPPNALCLLKRN